MTERIGALLTELADIEAPPVPVADPIWRRAGRTRIRRRAAFTVAAVALGAAALTLTLVSTQPGIGPAGPPTRGGVGGLEPLPPRLTAPIGEVPTIAQRPTDRVQLLVETKLFERKFFLPRTKPVCVAIGCGDHSVPLGVGSDHAYRHVIDPRRLSGQVLLAPDGTYAAAVVSPVMYPGPSQEGGPEEGAPPVEQEWALVDLASGRGLPSVRCTGSAGWTRDGWFVCIPASGLPLTRYGIDSSGGLTGTEIGQASASTGRTGDITPELLGRNATALLGPADEPNAIKITSVAAGPTERIFYPGATEVRPEQWCGPDTVLVEADGYPAVLDLDGGVLSSGKVGWQAIGCRPDGSMLLQDPVASRLWLSRPDGTSEGSVLLPRGKSGAMDPSAAVVEVAIDAFDWRVGGPAARVPGFRPLEWVDEAALGLIVIGGVGVLVVRRRRKRRMVAATTELA
ncbi:MAG TPA: hypothetical protein VKG85_03100 [Actinomycetes bacterium]|nr:hypothetical protein [Actinomycetes bacterium]